VGVAAPSKLTVKVTADPADDITETDETNNAQTEVTTVTHTQCTGCVDLQLGQILATPNPVTNGSNLTYQFTVTNIGDLPAIPVAPDAIRVFVDLDRIPNESTFVSANGTNGFTCGINPDFGPVAPDSLTNPEVLCTGPVGGLAPSAGTTITVVATANTAAEPSWVDFDVAVDPENLVSEFREFNNTGGLRVTTLAP
jgi:hypothetical protein